MKMKFDSLIAGGGLAGLIAGIRLAEKGRKVILYTRGMSSLHFATGCIDLYGRAEDPFAAIQGLAESHPYAKCGINMVREAMGYFLQIPEIQHLQYRYTDGRNLMRITASGRPVPTYTAPSSAPLLGGENRRLMIATYAGYKGFIPEIMKKNLEQYFNHIQISEIHVPVDAIIVGEIAEQVAAYIEISCKDCTELILPSLPGSPDIAAAITGKTGKTVYEIPALPPSVPGMRLERALRDRFTALNGTLITGDGIESALYTGDRIASVTTDSGKIVRADTFILAGGSFLSGGLKHTANHLSEPVFGLQVDVPRELSASRFFSSQPFMSIGAATDATLRGIHHTGFTVPNLFLAGAVLGGYDPLGEGSGGGVSLATGYTVSERIIHET